MVRNNTDGIQKRKHDGNRLYISYFRELNILEKLFYLFKERNGMIVQQWKIDIAAGRGSQRQK